MAMTDSHAAPDRQWIRNNIVPLATLPAPDETFENTDLPADLTIQTLTKKGVVRAVGTTKREYENTTCKSHQVTEWAVKRDAHEKMETVLDADHSTAMPCSEDAPHLGFTTIEPGRYECNVCGEIHDREAMETDRGWSR